MTNDNYTKITWPEVRKGDVLFHENGDRLTVQEVRPHGYPTVLDVADYTRAVQNYKDAGFAPYRKVEPLPTSPGAYLDKDGNAWVLNSEDSRGAYWLGVGTPAWLTMNDAENFAPFTRLVPMPTEEQIRETMFKTDPGTIYGVDAVVDGMKSLLGGGDDE